MFIVIAYIVMCGSRGGTGGPDPLKNHKNKVFVSNTGPDPLKNHKDTKPAFNVGPSNCHLNGICWRADDDPFIVLFGPSPPHQLKKNSGSANDYKQY